MLSAFKQLLRLVFFPAVYAGGWVVTFLSIFKDALLGLYLLVFLIPQPNVWHKFFEYPLGKDFLDLLYFGVLAGIIIQGKLTRDARNWGLVLLMVLYSYISLWNSSFRFGLPLPITLDNWLLQDWKNYAQMIAFYILAFSVAKQEKDQEKIIILITIVVLLISVRSYRNFQGGGQFDWEKRVGGPFEAAGLGANHLGAFIAANVSFILGLFLFESRKWVKLLYGTTLAFGMHPLLFSYSRGAYLAFLVALIYFGMKKSRTILVLCVLIVVFWKTVLPISVVDRITMTRNENGALEHSASGRLDLWDRAIQIFLENPVIGIGFDGYAMSSGGAVLGNSEILPEGVDVHSIYMRILCEQGMIGFAIFILILARSFQSGWILCRIGDSQIQKGLGMGLCGSILALAVSNMFGDRWSYFPINSYFWIAWGIADVSIARIQSAGLQSEASA